MILSGIGLSAAGSLFGNLDELLSGRTVVALWSQSGHIGNSVTFLCVSYRTSTKDFQTLPTCPEIVFIY